MCSIYVLEIMAATKVLGRVYFMFKLFQTKSYMVKVKITIIKLVILISKYLMYNNNENGCYKQSF